MGGAVSWNTRSDMSDLLCFFRIVALLSYHLHPIELLFNICHVSLDLHQETLYILEFAAILY